jgi:hypothetical protein
MARWKLDMKEHEATPERLYLRRGLAAPRPARRHVHRRLGPAARVRAVEAGPPPRLSRGRAQGRHFVWRVKADLRRPALFLVALGLLLVARLVPRAAARRVRAALGR